MDDASGVAPTDSWLTPLHSQQNRAWQLRQVRRGVHDFQASTPQHSTLLEPRSGIRDGGNSPIQAFPSLESPITPLEPCSREHAETLPEQSNVPQVLYPMPKQNRPEYWAFVQLIPMSAFADLPVGKLGTVHAEAAYCLRCKCRIKFRQGQHGVKQHLQKFHMEYLRDVAGQVSRKRNADMSLRNNYKANTRQLKGAGTKRVITTQEQATINELTALWIAGNLRPLSTVSDSGLKALITFLTEEISNVTVKLPSRTQLRAEIVKQAAELRASLKAILQVECRHFSVTTDIWTSRSAKSFLALTVHYVTPQFKLKSWTLEVVSFPGKHTGLAISEGLTQLFNNWGLDPALCSQLLRDGAANGVAAANLLGVEHMSCIAHSLHLVVAGVMIKSRKSNADAPESETINAAASGELDSLEQGGTTVDDEHQIDLINLEALPWEQDRAVEELESFLDTWLELESQNDLRVMRATVQRFRSIAVYFHKSPKAWNRLAQIQVQRLHQRPLRTITDCPTRWNSAREMLVRMIDIEESLNLFFSYLTTPQGKAEFKQDKLLKRPSARDWFSVKCLVELLELFAATTDLLGEELRPTIPLALPCLRILKSGLNDSHIFDEIAGIAGDQAFVHEVVEDLQSVRKKLLYLFEQRFDSFSSKLHWISLLDPRLTDMPMFSDDEKSSAKAGLIRETIKVASTHDSSLDTSSEMSSEPEVAFTSPASKKAKSWMSRGLFGCRSERLRERTASNTTPQQDVRCKIEAEVHLYLGRAAEVMEKVDPLQWWEANARVFPTVAVLARKWLGCVATTIPSERAFSTVGNIITSRRSSLEPGLVRDVVFIHENYTKRSRTTTTRRRTEL